MHLPVQLPHRGLNLILKTFFCIALLKLAPACIAQNGTPDRAHELYQQKNYRQALPLLLAANKTTPNNPEPLLLAANCYYKLGENNYARQTCSYIVKNYSGSKEATAASLLLQKLLLPEEANATKSSSGFVRKSSARIQIVEESDRIAIDTAKMIEVVRPQADHPNVSANVEHCIRQAVQNLPPAVLELYRKNGLKVCISTTLLDKEPSLKNREGRGYDGYTFRACPGMFNGREIIICEKTIEESDESLKESRSLPDIVNTLYHECGHAVDYYKGNISSTEEFKHAYLLDAAKIEPETRAELAYFLQKSAAGQEECCGELIGILLGKSDKKADKMKGAFPLTIQLLKNKISHSL